MSAAATRLGTLLALAVVGAAVGCGAPTARNVLVVTLDTTRADHLGAYGYAGAHTPNFDHFGAERAVRFEQALSAVPVTLPSHTSIFTGTYPAFHGVHDNDGYRLDDGLTTLAELFRDRGFDTAAFVAAQPLVAAANLGQGFDLYDDDFEADWSEAEVLARTALDFGFLERRSDQVNLAFERWLESEEGRPFFAWVHYFDPHQPYDLRPPFDSMFSDRPYDAEIAFMDESFGRLLDLLAEHGALDRTLVVVVGDHGEGLGQHGEPTHASFLFNATLRVPLWIASPLHADLAGSSVRELVRTIDVAPTVLDLMGLPAAAEMQGRSLRPLLEGGTLEPEPALLETYYNWFQYGWSPSRALFDGRYKIVEGPQPHLFDLEADAAEERDLAASEPQRVGELLERLRRTARRMDSGRPDRSVAARTDEEASRKLRALGYLGGGVSKEFRAVRFPDPDELAGLPEPSDHTLELRYANLAAEMIRTGNFSEGVRAARSGLAVDPTNVAMGEYLARGLAGLGLTEEAIRVLDELLERRPDNVILLRLSAGIHQSRQEHRALIAALERVAALGEARAVDLAAIGGAYLQLAEYRQAADHFEAALELGGPKVGLLTDLANALVELGDAQGAIARYQQALDLDPSSVRTRFFVGQFYFAAGNREFAEQMFDEILQLDPDHVGARVFLARLRLARGASAGEVAPLLEEAVRLSPESVWGRQAQDMLRAVESGPG